MASPLFLDLIERNTYNYFINLATKGEFAMKGLWGRFWYRMNHDPFFAYVMVYLFIGVIIGIVVMIFLIRVGYFT